MARPRAVDGLAVLRVSIASLLSVSLLMTPLYAASAPFGIVVFADRAHVGTALTSVGTTVYGGDRLSTETLGSVQVRLGAARLLLANSSSVLLIRDEASPAANLTAGTATFSTANAKAFAVHVATAVIRPATGQPTVGRVTVLSAKELVVTSVRGPLTIAVEDDVREIPERMAYHVVLDPNALPPQGPQGAGGKGTGAPPIKAAKSKFLWYVVAFTALVTYFVLDEALESDPFPH